MPVVLAGSASLPFAQELARLLDARLAQAEARRFPDGEGYVRILEPVQGQDVVVVQSTAPDANLVELLLWQDAAWEAGARSVAAVVPYLGYARQDRAFQPGEAVSSRAAARAIAAGSDRVLTIDPHKPDILRFFGGKGHAASAVPQLADALRAWGVEAVLAPDKGARERAEEAARRIGAKADHLEKTRLSATEVRMQPKSLDVHGRRVAIVDDLIASGGTMLVAAQQLKAQGATAVYAACTHGLFTNGAVPRLLAGGIDRILTTDTLSSQGCAVVSAAPAAVPLLDVVA
ncbi:MAG TPA: ribose-phosphate diphosphokinase [Candidatus Thermoplasmatota archaeon]|nr:ribose-phosphate diphosphokinase [Candidatus Thermoplasmatota archaeon]